MTKNVLTPQQAQARLRERLLDIVQVQQFCRYAATRRKIGLTAAQTIDELEKLGFAFPEIHYEQLMKDLAAEDVQRASYDPGRKTRISWVVDLLSYLLGEIYYDQAAMKIVFGATSSPAELVGPVWPHQEVEYAK